jgi:aminoglycoside phosphotransferase (APT) family kinase protein
VDAPSDFGPAARPAAEGFPEKPEVCEIYAREGGFDLGILDYFLAFGYWKLACISAVVLAQYRAQNSAGFAGLATQARRCALAAAAVLERA